MPANIWLKPNLVIKMSRGVVQTSHVGGHQSLSLHLPFLSPLPSVPHAPTLPSLSPPFSLPLPSPSLPSLPLPSRSLPPVPSLPLPLEVGSLKSS